MVPDGTFDRTSLEVLMVGASGAPVAWDTGTFQALEDIDGDGLLDLVTPRAFTASREGPASDLQTPPNLPGVRRVLPGSSCPPTTRP